MDSELLTDVPPHRPVAARTGDRQTDYVEAVRTLIGQAASAPEDWTVTAERLVLLDLEIDGVRCTLSRNVVHHGSLSPREREITDMLAQGMSNKAIARDLDISTFTVASHLRRIFMKLGVSTRAGVVGAVRSESELPRPIM